MASCNGKQSKQMERRQPSCGASELERYPEVHPQAESDDREEFPVANGSGVGVCR